MSLSNPATNAQSAAGNYICAILDLLGDRDPVAVQQQFPKALRSAVAGLGDDELRRPEPPGKWSIIEVVQHIADVELVYGYRLRMTVAHDTPAIQSFDQDLWASRLHYQESVLEDALEQIEVLSRVHLRLLRSLAACDWSRHGVHAERGNESIDRLARLHAGHGLAHLRQIGRIRGTHAGV